MSIRWITASAVIVVGALGINAGAQTDATGSMAPTFSKDVAPILYRNCTTCHHPGELAPMSLMTYQDARPWARSIRDQVSKGAMPPWHADAAYGHFENDRRLSDADKAAILRWIDGGAPEGDEKDLPAPPQYSDGWSIGKPDVVLSMQEDYPIPEAGTVPYSYFEVPTNFTEDRWVQAFEVRPGNRTVVHHVIVYTRPPRPAQPAQTAARPEATRRPPPAFKPADGMEIPEHPPADRPKSAAMRTPVLENDRPPIRGVGASIGGYVPGTSSRVFAPGTAIRIPAGTAFVFQMHYTTTGKATTDRTRIGLVFAKEPPKTELVLTALVNGSFKIPAGATEHRVDASTTTQQDVLLWSMLPHTHVRGVRWQYEVTYPDGRSETILSVPRYDFNWQTDYIFAEPLKLPKGSVLHATAWYDNSSANKSNPDPTTDVWWGDQTWEEMMFTAMTYSVDRGTGSSSSAAQQ